jgi:hypothetical protein
MATPNLSAVLLHARCCVRLRACCIVSRTAH